MRNTLGALDQRRSCEQAVVLFAKQTGADFTVLRVGDLQTGGRADVTLARGDVLDGSTTPSSAAHALAQVVARQNPVARNVSLGVQGAGEKERAARVGRLLCTPSRTLGVFV